MATHPNLCAPRRSGVAAVMMALAISFALPAAPAAASEAEAARVAVVEEGERNSRSFETAQSDDSDSSTFRDAGERRSSRRTSPLYIGFVIVFGVVRLGMRKAGWRTVGLFGLAGILGRRRRSTQRSGLGLTTNGAIGELSPSEARNRRLDRTGWKPEPNQFGSEGEDAWIVGPDGKPLDFDWEGQEADADKTAPAADDDSGPVADWAGTSTTTSRDFEAPAPADTGELPWASVVPRHPNT